MPRSHAHPDHPSRVVGLLTFFGGIAMLALVFWLAYHLFTQPVPGLNLSNPPQGVPPPAANIGIALSAFLEKLLLLALLTIVGSLVASKGVHLVFAAAHGHGPEPDPAAAKNGTGALPVVTPSSAPAAPPPWQCPRLNRPLRPNKAFNSRGGRRRGTARHAPTYCRARSCGSGPSE